MLAQSVKCSPAQAEAKRQDLLVEDLVSCCEEDFGLQYIHGFNNVCLGQSAIVRCSHPANGFDET